MTSKTEALKIALECAERCDSIDGMYSWADTINAIKEALAQQSNEQVDASAWFALVMNAAAEIEDASNCLRDEDARRVAIRGAKHYRDAANALFSHPPVPTAQPKEPEQGPVAWEPLTDSQIVRDIIRERHTTPPQRTWVGLTIQEANELWESTDSDWELMKRTEAKLKKKNE